MNKYFFILLFLVFDFNIHSAKAADVSRCNQLNYYNIDVINKDYSYLEYEYWNEDWYNEFQYEYWNYNYY